MRVYKNEEMRWSMLRYDSRTFTAQQAKMLKGDVTRKEIPEKYIYIDDGCFRADGRMREVILPPNCKIIGREAFFQCQIRKEVVLPKTLTEIKRRAFSENHSLRAVHFPASLKTLGPKAYRDCTNLLRAVFAKDSECREIQEGAFDSCSKLKRLVLPDHVEVIGSKAFFRCKELKKVIFPDTLKVIEAEAFRFTGLEELNLPEGLVELGESAFFKCNNLKHVVIPESVDVIERWVFHGCNRLETVEIRHDPEYVGPWIVNKSCTIRCYKGSKMDAYCDEYELKREYIGAESVVNE